MGPLHLVNFNYRMAGAMVNLMTVARMSAVDHARLPGFFTFLQPIGLARPLDLLQKVEL